MSGLRQHVHCSSSSQAVNGKAEEPEEPRTPPIIIASKDDYYDGKIQCI